MNKRIVPVAAVALLALAGCGSPSKYSANPAHPTDTPAGNSGPATISVGDSSLGAVLKDSSGNTLYFYGKDTMGEKVSACTGVCIPLWPPVAAPANPTLGSGVSGKLGTVKGPNGKPQLTINGHPLYTFARDKDAEDAYGQGFQRQWWVVNLNGKAVKGISPSEGTGGGNGGGGY